MPLNVKEIARRRIALGITQADAADRAAMTNQSAWRRLESGNPNPTLLTMERIAAVLQCTVCDLLTSPKGKRK